MTSTNAPATNTTDASNVVIDTVATDVCLIVKEEAVAADYVNYATLPMLFLVILLSFLVKRNRLCPECCNGRPGVLVPVNLVKDTRARTCYTAAFVILTSRLYSLIMGELYWAESELNDAEFNDKYGFVSIFIRMINSVQLSICFYPLFACIELRRHAFVNILGILNLLPWMYYTINGFIGCDFRIVVDNVGNLGAIMAVVGTIPEFLSYIHLIVFFVGNFIIQLRQQSKLCSCISVSHPLKTQNELNYEHEPTYMKYVRELLKREMRPKPEGLMPKVKEMFTYRKISGLKTSPRVSVTIAVAGVICLQSACKLTAFAFNFQPVIFSLLDNLRDTFDAENSTASRMAYDAINGGYVGFYLCNALALLAQVINLWRVLVNYRTDLRRVYRGEKNLLEYVDMSQADLLVYSSRYSGYQIVFTMYSYSVIFIVLFLVVVVLFGFLIVLPLKHHTSSFVIDLIEVHWKTVLISFVIYYAQILMAKFVFYKDGVYENRRWYHVTDYFLFFFNALLSLFTSLKRILVSAAVGMLYLSRLDQCGVMRGFETFDSGHKAYLGMLYLETQRNNPIVHAFIKVLQQNVPVRGPRIVRRNDTELAQYAVDCEKEKSDEEKRLHFRHMQMKWFKLITLVNNPILVLEQMSKTMIKVRQDAEEAEAERRNTQISEVDGNPAYQANGDVVDSTDVANGAEEAVPAEDRVKPNVHDGEEHHVNINDDSDDRGPTKPFIV